MIYFTLVGGRAYSLQQPAAILEHGDTERDELVPEAASS